MPSTTENSLNKQSGNPANRTVSLRLTEKLTSKPIVDLLVRVDCNGITVLSAHTGADGSLPVVSGLRGNDRVEVSVRRLGGGFKLVTSFTVHDGANDFTLFSPKAKVSIPTDDHFITGVGEPDVSDEIEVESSTGKDIKVRKVRSASNHPKVILSGASNANPLPQQCTIENLLFPLEKRPAESYHQGARKFGYPRDNGTRRHAGIDLYAPVGTPIRSMADGTVIWIGDFYCGTSAVEVDHGEFIARYGEIKNEPRIVAKGEKVLRGQKLGEVGKLIGMNISMLHLEMYATNLSPFVKALTDKSLPPFKRRDDLIDPTPSIDIAVME